MILVVLSLSGHSGDSGLSELVFRARANPARGGFLLIPPRGKVTKQRKVGIPGHLQAGNVQFSKSEQKW